MKYKEYNDYELLNYVREDDENALVILYEKYQPYIQKYAKKLYPYVKGAGTELSDLMQEGLLGLTNAVNHFQDNKETTFFTYATTCIQRKMISAVVATGRLKNKILNDSISIETVDDNGNSYSLEYLLGDESQNPEKVLLSVESQNQLIEKAKDILTPLESNVFLLKISGFDYKEIATILEKDSKSIDNAWQRIKGKLKKQL